MGPLESGYEEKRMRQGLGANESNDAARGIGVALLVSLGGVAIVAVFIYWIGTIFNPVR